MKPRGAPGDVYVCDPDDHKADHQENAHDPVGSARIAQKTLWGSGT